MVFSYGNLRQGEHYESMKELKKISQKPTPKTIVEKTSFMGCVFLAYQFFLNDEMDEDLRDYRYETSMAGVMPTYQIPAPILTLGHKLHIQFGV